MWKNLGILFLGLVTVELMITYKILSQHPAEKFNIGKDLRKY